MPAELRAPAEMSGRRGGHACRAYVYRVSWPLARGVYWRGRGCTVLSHRAHSVCYEPQLRLFFILRGRSVKSSQPGWARSRHGGAQARQLGSRTLLSDFSTARLACRIASARFKSEETCCAAAAVKIPHSASIARCPVCCRTDSASPHPFVAMLATAGVVSTAAINAAIAAATAA